MGNERGSTARARESAADGVGSGIPWDRVGRLRLPLSSYYADLKARRFLRAFVRAGRSEAERSKRGQVVNHWLLQKKVSSVEIVHAIKRVRSDA